MSRVLPVVLDLVLVVVFAALGRRSHAEGMDLAGLARTALPFLAGTAVGWVVAGLVLGGDGRGLAFGAVVVAATVAVGMLLRVVTGQGTAVSFVVVATLVLSAFLLGWRLVARWVG